ncbi:MAG: radical SAM family heme chaperone HemW [Lachnospiraceae bacterium]|nr:radical SAM family heme chaperone HemW [Lachnospiraceae bacterium]
MTDLCGENRRVKRTAGDGSGSPLELYVHVPFCVRKCGYCDFYSAPGTEKTQKAYVDTVIREIGESPFGKAPGETVTSVFFGGGTPSILPEEELFRILDALRSAFRFSDNAEITVECNPGTVTPEKLSAYREAGVNRISLGLQSADDGILKRIGRIHSFRDFTESYRAVREAGFSNVSVDLISGLPGDTPENFEKGLKTVLDLRPEHLSVYALILAENTPFYALYEAGKLDLPSEEAERAEYHLARRLTREEGYEQYEISNFALPGYRCRQNEGYWTHVPYLGFGSAAASFYGGKRFQNAESLSYADLPYESCETLTPAELENEFLMLGFRRLDGISERDFVRRFGHSFFETKRREIAKLEAEGLIREKKKGGDRILALTERGLDLANRVFMEFV